MLDLAHWNSNQLKTDGDGFDPIQYARIQHELPEYDLAEKLTQWREAGVVVFEQCVPSSLINEFLADIDELCNNRTNFQLEVEHKGQRYPINELPVPPQADTGIKFNCMEAISLAARRLSLSRVVSSFLTHVFQEPPALLQSLTFWRGSEQPAHLDYPWVRTQTRIPHLAASWIPLEDVDADSGPLAYYPGSHKPGVIPPFDWGSGSIVAEPDSPKTIDDFVTYLREHAERKDLKKEIFTPKCGDVLIWHGNLLHEGTKVRDPSKTRKSYVSHYTGLSSFPPLHRHMDAIENGRATMANGGFAFDYPWNDGKNVLGSLRAAREAKAISRSDLLSAEK